MTDTNRLSFTRSKEFTERVESLIPGGSHTYSRGSDRFPQEAPNGVVRGKGAWFWDADGNKILDWAMGLTAVSLGHSNDAVNEAVYAAIQNGTIFSRTSQLELEAAEAFLSMTGTDMVKFARHGSAVTTSAVKLSRAFTGRAKVAVAKEHPFFSYDDWFIGSTACDFGIPDALKAFTLHFSYGDIDSLHALFAAHPGEIACIIMEPVKFVEPPKGYLNAVAELCRKNGTIFILDEMVTGLKFGVPGAAKLFGVEADLYTYGKGIANGFASAALTGRGDIMRMGGLKPEGARKLFMLSTTHGGESVGLAATIATLKQFRETDIVGDNWKRGEQLCNRLRAVVERHGLGEYISLHGFPCLPACDIRGPGGKPDIGFQTLFLQEMLAHGVLMQGLFVVTPSHREEEIAATERAFDLTCPVYKQALAQGSTEGLLVGPPMKPVFRKHL